MIKKIFALLLVLVMLVSVVACGDKPEETDTSASESVTTDDGGYKYPAKGSVGADFTALNFETYWDMNNQLDYSEDAAMGNKISAAVYKRNRALEEKLGIKFIETTEKYEWATRDALAKKLDASISAGDDEYDIVMLPPSYASGLISTQGLTDFSTIEGIDFSGDWWDKTINDTLKVDGKQYMASGAANLYAYDLTFSLYFNKKMMQDNQVELPYNLVKEGKWTFEKMFEYVSAAPRLNGAEGYIWKEGSTAIYGVAGHTGSINAFITSAGNNSIIVEGGKYTLNLANERTINTVEKIAEMLDLASGRVLYNQNDTAAGSYYYTLFKNSQAMFVTCETKSGMVFRDMTTEYGLIPMPKYDESQSSYLSTVSWNAALFAVPITVANTKNVGLVLDAFNYESLQAVTPEYTDAMLYQGLRDVDSVEMFNLIMETRVFDFGQLYGITEEYDTAIRDAVRKNAQVSLAGLNTKYGTAVQSKLNTILTAYGVAT